MLVYVSFSVFCAGILFFIVSHFMAKSYFEDQKRIMESLEHGYSETHKEIKELNEKVYHLNSVTREIFENLGIDTDKGKFGYSDGSDFKKKGVYSPFKDMEKLMSGEVERLID